ncbi:MAG: hypothetical protein ACRDOO_13535, partial [Actinomadura sp.]
TTALLATTGVAAATGAGGGGGGLGGSLIRSAIVAKQVTALHSRAELKNVCQAVIEGWYGAGRGTRDRAFAARTVPRTALSTRPPVRTVGRLGLRPLRERAFDVRALLWQGRGDRSDLFKSGWSRGGASEGDPIRVRFWRPRTGTQGFARPSSLSITPST